MNCLAALFPQNINQIHLQLSEGVELNCYIPGVQQWELAKLLIAVTSSKQLWRPCCSLAAAEGIPFKHVHSSSYEPKQGYLPASKAF